MAYLDAASGEPLHPAARDALTAAFDRGWADPSRLYSDARRARALLDQSRAVVAEAIGARADEISFTSSGAHANQLAFLGLVRGHTRRSSSDGPTACAVVSAVEHSGLLKAAEWFESDGGAVTHVGVDRLGRVSIEDVAAAAAGAAFVCVQSANHEVGTRQPVAALRAALHTLGPDADARPVPLLVDAAQSVGRSGPDLTDAWDVLTASAHKWGGPPGVGVLAVRPGARWRAPLPGDEREAGRVTGFENVPAIVASAAALQAVLADADREDARLSALVDLIRTEIPRRIPDVEIVGDPNDRLPHLVTFSCLYVDGEALVAALDRADFAISSGSSCTSSTLEPSHVLVAMGALTHGNVRVSLPRGLDAFEVERFLDVLAPIVAELRADTGATDL